MNFARLNHILIPATAEERERWRRRRLVRLMSPLAWAYFALSEEGRVLSVLALFVGSAAVDVGRTQVHLLWAALLGLIMGALAIRNLFSLPGVRLEAVLPARVTAGEAATVELFLENRGTQSQRNVRVRRPFLPWDGAWLGSAPVVPEVLAGATVRVHTTLRFIQRGPHHLDPFMACQVAATGLSVGPHIESDTCRTMVLPRPAHVRRMTLALRPAGPRGSRRRLAAIGDATDLAGVRPYRPGDPVRTLHARTWARTGQPHVREYQREQQVRIGIVLFAARPSHSETAFEAAVSVVTGLVAKAARGEGVVELAVFGEDVRSAIVGRGVAPPERALDLLASALEARTVKEPGSLSGWLATRTKTLSGLYLVSASIGPELPDLARAARARGLPNRCIWVLERRAMRLAPAEGRTLCAEDVRAGEELEL